ncbi:MAG: hypothetical protein VX119_03585 [Bacteroidota bacterium]|nr:hypothetical protein [Bacteroidota bacterium]MEC8835268.1 hypothetical protein [Bacteroidota bacterium]
MIERDMQFQKPIEQDAEDASNSYLIALIVVFPLLGFLASALYLQNNRKSSYFVRWHCMQALLSQVIIMPLNSYCFWWTFSVVRGDLAFSTLFVITLTSVFLFNVLEVIALIYTAVKVRAGEHVEWRLYRSLTNFICKV